MSMVYIPNHTDLNLNDEWWASKGITIGKEVFYNAIRDRSGRYNGYITVLDIRRGEFYVMETVAEAEKVLKLMEKKNGKAFSNRGDSDLPKEHTTAKV